MSARRKAVGLSVMGLTLFSALAQAAEDCQKQIMLNQASGGVFMEARGTAGVTAHGARQNFTVTITAPVYNGVPFLVYANGQLAGTITIAQGSGQLQLSTESKRPLPTGLKSVCKIGSVKVTTSDGGVVLQGRF